MSEVPISEVTVPLADGGMPAYLATPAGEGPWPGVVVVPDWLGMTTDVRHQADWLARSGYLALVPDLYHWGGRLRCMVSTLRQASSGSGRAYDDLEAARAWLHAQPSCTGRIGVIGFCMGGGFALMLAGTGAYGASSVNYGMIKEAETVLAASCPVVASYGGRDRSLRSAPGELGRALDAHGVPHDIKTYPDAGHGFLNDHAPGETPLWARVAGTFVRNGYHEPSAVDARRRILACFGQHLRETE